MRAQLLTGFGGPDRLQYREDVPVPVPAPDEVRIRVAATGINNTDIWTREGRYGRPGDPSATTGWRREPLKFPRIQGGDIVGYVDRAGAHDSHPVGARVIVDPVVYTGDETQLASPELIGSERDGGFADYVTVPAGNAHRIDSRLSDAELATFPIAYSTALRMLNRAAVGEGETVLVTGASGGVGSALVQLAAVRGARVVAVVGRGEPGRETAKHDAARELGAALTVDRDVTDLPAATAAAGPVDVVADVVGGPAFGSLLDTLRPFGRYVTAGAIAGPLVETDLRTVYLKQLHLIGSSFASHEEFQQLVELISTAEREPRTSPSPWPHSGPAGSLRPRTRRGLRPLLAAAYPLPDLAQAQADFVTKQFVGKLVVTVQN